MKDVNSFLNKLLFLTITAVAVFFTYSFLNKAEVKNQAQVAPKEVIKKIPQNVDTVVNKYLKQAQLENLRQEVVTQKILIQTKKSVEEYQKQKRLQDQRELEKIPLEQQIWTKEKTQKLIEESSAALNEQTPPDQELEPLPEKPLRKPSKVDSDSFEAEPLE